MREQRLKAEKQMYKDPTYDEPKQDYVPDRHRGRKISCQEACGMSGCNNSYCSNYSGYKLGKKRK